MFSEMTGLLNPFRAPESLPTLNPTSFVPKNGFPVGKGLINPKSPEINATFFFLRDIFVVYLEALYMGFFYPVCINSSFIFLLE